MSNELPHACAQMESAIGDITLPVNYDPSMREYSITYSGDGSVQVIAFCPFCGARLPDSVRTAYFERRDALDPERKNDPPLEMQSDQWWREAGL